MKIYLAARYGRRDDLCGYRAELTALGHTVASRWLDGDAPADDGDDGVSLPGTNISPHAAAMVSQMVANDDLDDLYAADCLISFTEPPGLGPMRGGRHTEFGIALGINRRAEQGIRRSPPPIRLIVVGHRENVFYCLDSVVYFPTWEKAKEYLAGLV